MKSNFSQLLRTHIRDSMILACAVKSTWTKRKSLHLKIMDWNRLFLEPLANVLSEIP
jgi:hypothetical protein